jgi:CrcB protein
VTSLLAVACGGAVGAAARYGIGLLLARLLAAPFPWGTWAVNLLGCLLIGVAAGTLAEANLPTLRLLVVTGFLGAFTTFSTFSYDTLHLWTRGHATLALVNAGGSVLLGLVFVWIGLQLVQG